jgi:CubicO group peptidase (beta-lactamase class C family)
LATARLLPAALLALIAGCTTMPVAPHRATVRVTFTPDRIEAVRTVGHASPGTPASIDSPVRVASVSKLLVALVVMRLVEAGTLDLDRDVSDYLGWSLRNPAFADRPVSLRMLLSHTSSVTDGGDYIVALGRRMRDFVGTASWDRLHPPGSFFRYANLNYGIIGTVIERATGERFDRVMTRELFAPLGIDGGFNWSGASDAAIARAVMLRAPDGRLRLDDLGGRPPPCPVYKTSEGPCDLAAYVPGDNGALFSPQGGARVSMRGLARIGQLLLGGGIVDGRRYLAATSINTLIAPAWRFNGGNGDTEDGFYCAFGLGVMLVTSDRRCRDNPYVDGRARFGHAGEAYNLRSALWIDADRRRGDAWFVTAVADDAPDGASAYTREEERLAAASRRP